MANLAIMSVCIFGGLILVGPHDLAGQVTGPGQVVEVDRQARSISFPATLQAEAFLSSLPPDHQYHAVVNDQGSAAGQSLFVTPAADSTVARLLREFGADDGGGVPLAAWNLRWVPLVRSPDSRVSGTRVEVEVTWDGAPRVYALDELLEDSGGRGVEMRFGGNESHNEHWDSGCVICLYSCPGGVISNALYSIRDHQRSRTSFDPGALLPPDGTDVTITLTLVPD